MNVPQLRNTANSHLEGQLIGEVPHMIFSKSQNGTCVGEETPHVTQEIGTRCLIDVTPLIKVFNKKLRGQLFLKKNR